jgi:hypothetical protein
MLLSGGHMNGHPVRPLCGLLMIPSYAVYLGTAYWLESCHVPLPIIASAFVAQGALLIFILPAALRRYRWSMDLKCAAAMAWLIDSGIVAGILKLRSLPGHQEALVILAYLAVVVLVYVVHFRRRCPG